MACQHKCTHTPGCLPYTTHSYACPVQVPHMPILLVHWFYALSLSLFLGALWDLWCCAATLLGVPVAPSFDQPW